MFCAARAAFPPSSSVPLYDILQSGVGTIVCACEDCATTYRMFRSCGNRHCPTCQGEKAINWFNTRIDRLMPVHHFMITCAVPAEFRDFFRSHQRFAYSALFQATSKTMISLAAGRRWRSHYPLPFFICISRRHLEFSCHHDGKRSGLVPIHRFEKRHKQTHESFAIRVHPEISPTCTTHRIHEDPLLRLHAPLVSNAIGAHGCIA